MSENQTTRRRGTTKRNASVKSQENQAPSLPVKAEAAPETKGELLADIELYTLKAVRDYSKAVSTQAGFIGNDGFVPADRLQQVSVLGTNVHQLVSLMKSIAKENLDGPDETADQEAAAE